ncbi:MAG: hypothetical protein Q8K63_02865 [Acidimicrobiales bacterium]|nr:hypothetical protein [Acidimicrobiales bacterium]
MVQPSRVSDTMLGGLMRNASPDLEPVIREFADRAEVGLHLAVFVEPYLSHVFDGSKTVESRFSARPIAPHGRVATGDVILLKRSGQPITGWCRAGTVWSYALDPASWTEIRHRFTASLRAQGDFWESRKAAHFATLIQVEDVHKVRPTPVNKRDRRGWVVLADRDAPRLL